MAQWQEEELVGATGISYLVGSHEDATGNEPDGAELRGWQEQLGFEADALLLDRDRRILDAYIDANPGPRYTEAVTVILDRRGVIRRVGSTYDTDHDGNLELLLELLAEE